jgi:arylsulfatase
MKRRHFLASTALAATAVAGHSKESAQAADSQPNVLFIMTDQHRKAALGCYGDPVIKTPHIDKLAEEGVLCEQCWTQHPVCMPSRAAIFTGRYPMANGVRSNGVELPKDEITMAHSFAKAGYRTGGAGKFHFENHFDQPPFTHDLPRMENHPEPYYGFQEFHIGQDGRRGEQAYWIKTEHPQWAGKPDHEIPLELHNSTWATDHTLRFIRDSHQQGKPFFSFCSFVDPHHGYNPPSPYREMYREEDMPAPIRREGELEGKPLPVQKRAAGRKKLNENVAKARTQYYGEVTLIDDSIGRILDLLEELGIRDNTIIAFTADHGDLLGDHWDWYKGYVHYEHSASVPMIFNWGRKLQQGKHVENIVQSIDIFPTLAKLAGISLPDGVQGKSQVPVLTGGTEDTGYTAAFIDSYVDGLSGPNLADSQSGRQDKVLGGNSNVYTLRTLQWRYSYYVGADYGELYDLKSDPNEFENRWDDPKLDDVKRRLKGELMDRIIEARDPLPVRTHPY